MSEKMKEYQKDYQKEYKKAHYKQYFFQVSLEHDQDMIDHIEKLRERGVSFMAYARECIRDKMDDEAFTEEVIRKVEEAREYNKKTKWV